MFEPGQEIIVADRCEDLLRILEEIDDAERAQIGAAARRRVQAEHTADKRVDQLHDLVAEVVPGRRFNQWARAWPAMTSCVP